tara:strand:+ start:227 stop:487 length:261 start_codon:yes stop_codon:yes gene_type:complete
MTIKQEARLLLNNEIKVIDSRSEFYGQTGIVKQIMHDGRTLDIKLSNGKFVFLDVTFVSEINERTHYAKGEPDLGPVANSVIQDHK